ncbi:glycosyltransferase family 4 protein [Patescibacteria group bacterium]|nr:glycosyltransferase family 4 protein [Patescibacteria group bacterium]
MQNKLKILYIANARIPTEKAHGIQIAQMLNAFANFQFSIFNFQTNSNGQISKKLDVELVIPRRLNKIKEDLFEYYGIKRNFKITKLPCLDLVGFGKLGFLIETVSFLISVKIYLLFRKYEILYSREPLVGLFFKNYVLEVHQMPARFLKRPKAFVVLTSFIKKRLTEKGISENKILVAPDGVDLEKFDTKISKEEAREKLDLPKNKKIAVYTGHLYEWKGAQTLAEASQYLPKDTEVYFVGGTTEDQRKFEIRNLKLEINVVGHRPPSEIPLWLKAADVLVLPNSAQEDISKFYTSPMKLFEYMASKRPIISSDLPSLREILNEKNAILIPPDNVQALSDGIEKILADDKLAEKLSAQAFIDVQNYTWEKRAENILKFICQ